MKMRSTIFLTLSLIVHAVCITALALSHFKGKEAPGGGAVEVTMGEGAKDDTTKLVEANEVKPVAAQPEIKPIEKSEEVKPLPKKEAPKPKKIVKAKKAAPVVATELPAKEKTEEPEQLSPKLEDSDAVAVAATPEEQKEEAPKFIPVKEQVAAKPLDEAEEKTEANSEDAQAEDPAPQPVKEEKPADQPATSGKTEKAAGTALAALGQGGDSKAEAVNYLSLTQYSGNKAPEYPLAARKEQRQGQVDLLYRVTKEGRVTEVSIAKSSGHKDLDESAVKAIAKFKFVSGQEGWAKHAVIFKLAGATSTLPSKLRTNSAATE